MATPGSYLTPTTSNTRTSSNGGMERSTTSSTQSNQTVGIAAQTNPYGNQNTRSMAQTNQGGAPQWNLPQWNPQQTTNSYGGPPLMPSTYTPPNPAGRGGVETGFFGGGGENFFKPDAFNAEDNPYAKYIAAMLPVAQFGQNNFQYRNDFNEAQRRWEAEFGATQGQNQFQQALSTRQQMSAEEQARLAAQQWAQQFGHTQYMDEQGLGLRRTELGLQGQQIGNQFTMGMDANQATRDVAGTYANANMYGADQQRLADMYGADQQLAGTLGAANIYGGAQRYGAELGLQGTLGSAEMYSGAQRYGAELGLQGTRYTSDTERAIAAQQNQFLYAQLAQQAQQQQLERENAMRMASMAAFGRSQAPAAQWARGWN